MSRASVCFVNYFSLPILAREYNHHGAGGEEVQQALLARAFARRGYDVKMVVADYGQPDGAAWHGVKTYKAFDPRAGLPLVRFLHPQWTGLVGALRRADADVYYVSMSGMHVGQVVMFAHANGRRALFRIAHDANCDPRKVMLKHWRDRKLYEYGLRRADVILAQTARQQEMLRRNYGLESRIATMLVEPAEHDHPLDSRDVHVLWVNNLRDFKRPGLFVELARELPDWRFHLVGGPVTGHEDVHRELEIQVASAPNFVHHGRVPYHDVNDLFERTRVFVNTSETEGFPNSYLQAWTRGVPVVAFFDPDGVIRKEGLGFAVASLEEMREGVRRLLSDPALWRETSERCRRYMEREYGEDRVLAPYVEEVDRLAALRRGDAGPGNVQPRLSATSR
jgi:glycosyltransferase involved in cell wall biosynthesis